MTVAGRGYERRDARDGARGIEGEERVALREGDDPVDDGWR